ncbi:MAG: 23S rRNA (uracil(1939)-C(5))-methyltransferase RlmD [Leptolyngbyaceae cyanobacterium bins.59]|nr:23S rRNA (uracil(1939)-C(5))-methyltransferase RlmD [Leptolyngbyaceae cyanobacterium bins.59]
MTNSKVNSEGLTLAEWQQGDEIETEIFDLTDDGDGVGRVGQRVVFVPDTAPGDRVRAKLTEVKSKLAHAKVLEVLEPSPHRIRPRCIVADKCGGCQWQHISEEFQLETKRQQVVQALSKIGGFAHPSVEPTLSTRNFLDYRNKASYPIGRSHRGQVQAGYYQRGSHRLINLNQCPIQDARFNPFLAEIKQDIQEQGWQVYHEDRHQGEVRHLSLRIGRRTGEILLTLVLRDDRLPGLEAQAQEWMKRYPDLVGVCINHNPDRTNVIFGKETRCLVGRDYIREEFAGLTFQIQSDTFFQVNTEQAEALLQEIEKELQLQGDETLLDAYCGIGTMTLPLARRVRQAVGLELQAESIRQAQKNARLNQIDNARFLVGAVERLLPKLDFSPEIVLLDPPRKGCERSVLETLLAIRPDRIVYVSCKPATLARDLKILCQGGQYRFVRAQPADFFPQTAHVECAAFLQAVY